MNDKQKTNVLKTDNPALLKLDDLSVQSFVTALTTDERKRIRGGHTVCPGHNSGGGSLDTWCWWYCVP